MHSTPFPILAQLPGSFEPPPLRAPDGVPPLVCHSSPLKALPSVPRSPCLPSSVTHKLGQDAASEIHSHPPRSQVGSRFPPHPRGFMRTLLSSAGWYEGERLRDGERGWFPMECAKEITCQATIDKNVERMRRLLGLETNV